MLVKDLKARAPIAEMELEIVSKAEPRAFASEKGEGTVCNCAAKDKKGVEVSFTLWNDQIGQVNEGDKVKITEGWCSEFRGSLQVSTGKKGKLEIVK